MAVAASALALLTTPTSTARPAAALSTLVLRGHGFGHGIGLSQWGAEKRAESGETYRQILAFYYPGTTVGTARDRPVRVLLAERARVQVGSKAPFTVEDAAGLVIRLPAGLHSVGADGVIDGRALQLPVVARPGAAPLRLGGTAYPGTLTLLPAPGLPASGLLRVVDTVGLEEYLVGVVSSECPGSWRPAALRAQAVASRSFALSSLRPGEDFDLFPDDRSQNFHGLLKHLAPAAAAVRATSRQVLHYQGRVIPALFTAANGGLTSTTDGIWGGTTLPYYAVRRDGFDAAGPDTDWGPVVLTLDAVRRAFPQVPVGAVDVSLHRNGGRRVTGVTFVDPAGAAATVGGYEFQQRFGLRSTYFTISGH